MYSDRRRDISHFFSKDGIPVTLGMIIAAVAMFILIRSLPHLPIFYFVGFVTNYWPSYFWTPLTWSIVGPTVPLDLIFAAGWFFTFGGSLERSWGTRVYALFIISISVIMALSVWLGSFVCGQGFLGGLWLIAGPMTVAWAVINRRETVSLFFLPLPAPIIALVGVAITWFDGGAVYGNPLIGIFALTGCAAAYWYAMFGRYSNAGLPRQDDSYGYAKPKRRRNTESEAGGFGIGKFLRDRREKKRLEELFRRSGYDDDLENRR